MSHIIERPWPHNRSTYLLLGCLLYFFHTCHRLAGWLQQSLLSDGDRTKKLAVKKILLDKVGFKDPPRSRLTCFFTPLSAISGHADVVLEMCPASRGPSEHHSLQQALAPWSASQALATWSSPQRRQDQSVSSQHVLFCKGESKRTS